VIFNLRVEGFEPPTFWFVAKRSIQLGYTRLFCFYYIIKRLRFVNLLVLLFASQPVDFVSTSKTSFSWLALPLATGQLGYTCLFRIHLFNFTRSILFFKFILFLNSCSGGIEPPTYSFGNCYSIRLSYEHLFYTFLT
jgi:hypothetical protein